VRWGREQERFLLKGAQQGYSDGFCPSDMEGGREGKGVKAFDEGEGNKLVPDVGGNGAVATGPKAVTSNVVSDLGLLGGEVRVVLQE
jgi:hypothetical protein